MLLENVLPPGPADRLKRGDEYVADRIRQVDGEIEAWAHLSPDHALDQARALDTRRAEGGPVGPLHGVPIGIKDIFDTDALPTENGTFSIQVASRWRTLGSSAC